MALRFPGSPSAALTGVNVFCLALCLSAARAVNSYDLTIDNPAALDVGAQVNEIVNVDETDASLGQIGIHQDKGGAEKASITLHTDGSVTVSSTNAARARIVTNAAAGNVFGGGNADSVAPGTISLTGAFPAATIYAHYENIRNLTCFSGTCLTTPLMQGGAMSAYAAPKLLITSLDDDMANPGAHGGIGANGGTNGHWDSGGGGGPVDGEGITDSAGELKWRLGVTVSTDPSAPALYYASGTYAGSFDITLSY